MSDRLQILSLGAGVQSSALLLMSIKGILPRIDHCIFADTGWEPRAVYTNLEWLKAQAASARIPLSGSGTTACAAAALGRRGIGFDIRQSQVDLGKKRFAMPLMRMSKPTPVPKDGESLFPMDPAPALELSQEAKAGRGG